MQTQKIVNLFVDDLGQYKREVEDDDIAERVRKEVVGELVPAGFRGHNGPLALCQGRGPEHEVTGRRSR